ncbi:MAG: hypothetical protein ACREC9_05730 [Methylocella sp.]
MSTPVMDTPAVTEKASARADLRPRHLWALRIRGFENAGRAGRAIGQSMDK